MAADPWDAEDSLWDFSDSPISSEHEDAEKVIEKISRRVSLSVFADRDGDSDDDFSADTLHRIRSVTHTTYRENALKEIQMVSEAIMKADRENTLNLIDFGEVVQSHAEILQAKHKMFCKALKKDLLNGAELNEILLELAAVEKLLALQSLHAALRTLNGHATNLRTSSVNARKTTHKATFALFVTGPDASQHWRKLQRKTKKLRRQHDLFGRLLVRKYGGIWKKMSLPEGESNAETTEDGSGGDSEPDVSPQAQRKEHKKQKKQDKKEKDKKDKKEKKEKKEKTKAEKAEKEQLSPKHSPRKHRRRESRSDRKLAKKESVEQKEREKEEDKKQKHEEKKPEERQHEHKHHHEHEHSKQDNRGNKERKEEEKKASGNRDGHSHHHREKSREHKSHTAPAQAPVGTDQPPPGASGWVKRKCAKCGKSIKFQATPAHLRYEMLCPLCGTKQQHRSLELRHLQGAFKQ